MSESNNGGPAFPFPDTYHPNGQIEFGATGMTLRDYFAAKAMQGQMSMQKTMELLASQRTTPYGLACSSYDIADAMLKAREA